MASTPLLAGLHRWTSGTPSWGPERVTAILAHPRNARVVFVNGDGLSRSDDGGATWSRLPVAQTFVQTIAADPRSERVLFVDDPSGGVRRSTDGGLTWQTMADPATSPRIEQLTIAASAPETLFAYSRWPEPGLHRSLDSGASWHLVLPNAGAVAVAVDPADGRVVYAAALDAGVFKSTDGGETWAPSNAGLASASAQSIAVDAGDSRILHLVSEGFLHQSTDAGASWHRSASSAEGVYEVVSQSGVPGSAYARAPYAVGDRLFRTTDGGDTWTPFPIPDRASVIFDLAPVPGAPGRVFVAAGDVLETSDDGATWATLGEGPAKLGGNDLAVSPYEPETVYAAGGLHQFSLSSDGGRTWTAPTNAGFEPMATNNLAVARSTPETLYAGTHNGALRTRDRGETWERVPGTAGHTRVVLDPVNPAHLIVVTLVCSGRFCADQSDRSTDGGSTWSPIVPPVGSSLTAMLLTSTTPQILLGNADGALVRGDPDGPLELVSGAPDLFLLDSDPLHPEVIYGIGRLPPDLSPHCFRSNDRGATWTEAGTLASSVPFDLAIDPMNPDHVAVATAYDGILRSTDGGSSWLPFNDGLTETYFPSVTFSPDGRTLYAGTLNAVYQFTFCDDCLPRVEAERSTRVVPRRSFP